MQKSYFRSIAMMMAIVALLLAACGPQETETPEPTEETVATEEVVEEEATEEVVEEEATEEVVEEEATEEADMDMEATEEADMDMEATEEADMDMEATEEAAMDDMDMASFESICLVTDVGGVDDNGFNQLAHEGALQAQADYELDYQFIESNGEADYEPNINSCLEAGADAIITVGFLIQDATATAATENPDVYFVGVDQFLVDGPANFVGIQFREDQSGFLVGALAAFVANEFEQDTIAGVYGIDVPAVVRFRNGYEQGALYVNPEWEVGTNVLGAYADSFTDEAQGVSLAQQFIGEGAFVVFGAGGPLGSAAIREAASQGVYVIGVDTDEYFAGFGEGSVEGTEFLISSALKNVTQGVYDPLSWLAEGDVEQFAEFGGNNYLLDASLNGVGFAPQHEAESVPSELYDQVEGILDLLTSECIITGVDSVSGDLLSAEEVEAFVPAEGCEMDSAMEMEATEEADMEMEATEEADMEMEATEEADMEMEATEEADMEMEATEEADMEMEATEEAMGDDMEMEATVVTYDTGLGFGFDYPENFELFAGQGTFRLENEDQTIFVVSPDTYSNAVGAQEFENDVDALTSFMDGFGYTVDGEADMSMAAASVNVSVPRRGLVGFANLVELGEDASIVVIELSTDAETVPTAEGAVIAGSAVILQAPAIGVGETVTEAIATGERLSYELTLEDGQTVNVYLNGLDGLDTYLRIYDADGNLVAENDDFDGVSSGIEGFTVEGGGLAVLEVGTFGDGGAGDFELVVEEAMAMEEESEEASDEESEESLPTIVGVAIANEGFETLTAAVVEAGFVPTLNGEGTFTVFAPTDEAFAAALEALELTAEELLGNEELLTSVLSYHVIDSVAFSTDLTDGMEVETLNGATLTINVSEDGVTVTDGTGATYNVIVADIEASNGVVHVIDGVLLPPAGE